MSFHGAVLGVIFATIIFCKKNNQNIFYYLDLVALSAPIGIFLGRIANFINSELYGRETDIIWSVKFIQIDNLNRHPSQIYEAIFEGIVLFILLNVFHKKLSKINGLISSLFIIFYSIFRFFIEFTREPDAHIGLVMFSMSLGQILSIIFFILGTILFYKNYVFKK
jgi:phosphatidylglycerol:prolipoprotein diacylglycerol transferase